MHLALFGLLFVGFSWIALAVCLFLYAVRVFALTGAYHRYFSHNSFKTEDDSRNSLALALLTFGEGWHNLGVMLNAVGQTEEGNKAFVRARKLLNPKFRIAETIEFKSATTPDGAPGQPASAPQV